MRFQNVLKVPSPGSDRDNHPQIRRQDTPPNIPYTILRIPREHRSCSGQADSWQLPLVLIWDRRARDTIQHPDPPGHVSRHRGKVCCKADPSLLKLSVLVTPTATGPGGSGNTWGLKQAGTAGEQTWAPVSVGQWHDRYGGAASDTKGYRFSMASKIIISCFLFIISSHEIAQSLGQWSDLLSCL